MIINRHLLMVCGSALLLLLAYPTLGWWALAWFAFVPLLFSIDGKSPKQSFAYGWLFGFIFFTGALWWLSFVTAIGMIILTAYLALFIAVFAISYNYFTYLPLLPRVLLRACCWTVLEYLRSYLFTGFGWALLGHSQYQHLSMIQIADITGVYGVSFLVIWTNLTIFEVITFVNKGRINNRLSLLILLFLTGGLLAGAYYYGYKQLNQQHRWPLVNVGIVQPNIPQDVKWLPDMQASIVNQHIVLSKELSSQPIDLIVWPETALPGIISDEPALVQSIADTARDRQVPVLFGAVTQVGSKYFNSALLFNRNGYLNGQYDKIHLVPFGEFLPLRPLLGWINHFVALEDFTSGDKFSLFDVGQNKKAAGVLICFEDTLSHIRRGFARSGAKLWVNITNDAWFKDTPAPYMHLQAAVFGCVEHKRALVRAANTGFSGFIDPQGRVINSVHDSRGKQTFVAGKAIAQVPLVDAQTFYTKYADLFTMLCCCVILGFVLLRLRKA